MTAKLCGHGENIYMQLFACEDAVQAVAFCLQRMKWTGDGILSALLDLVRSGWSENIYTS